MWSVLPLPSTGFDYRLHLVICDRDQSVIWEESVFLPSCVKLSLSSVALCGCSVTLLHRKAGLPLVLGTLNCWKELAREELNGWLTLCRDETHLSLPHASVYWICIWVQLILYLTSSCVLDGFNVESFVEVFFVCVCYLKLKQLKMTCSHWMNIFLKRVCLVLLWFTALWQAVTSQGLRMSAAGWKVKPCRWRCGCWLVRTARSWFHRVPHFTTHHMTCLPSELAKAASTHQD